MMLIGVSRLVGAHWSIMLVQNRARAPDVLPFYSVAFECIENKPIIFEACVTINRKRIEDRVQRDTEVIPTTL